MLVDEGADRQAALSYRFLVLSRNAHADCGSSRADDEPHRTLEQELQRLLFQRRLKAADDGDRGVLQGDSGIEAGNDERCWASPGTQDRQGNAHGTTRLGSTFQTLSPCRPMT